MQQLETRGITERWIKGSWEEYLEAIKNLPENQGKSYYYNGYYRLEMTPIGFEHARDHHVVFLGVSLYAILKAARYILLSRRKSESDTKWDFDY